VVEEVVDMVVEEEADMVVAVVAVMVSAQAFVALCYAGLIKGQLIVEDCTR